MSYRDETKEVNIGGVRIGAGNPVAIQSMTNTPTSDVSATVSQILALEKVGCEIVRCTVPDEESAKAIKEIKKQIVSLYSSYDYLYNYEGFDTNEKTSLTKIIEDMDEVDAAFSLNLLSRLLEKYWKKKVL